MIYLDVMENTMEILVSLGILIFEYMGIGIIVLTGIVSFVKYIRHHKNTRMYLAKGLAVGLEFKLGSEILRTVVVREWKEIAIVGGIILLRAALTFLIHWEIKQEELAEKRVDT